VAKGRDLRGITSSMYLSLLYVVMSVPSICMVNGKNGTSRAVVGDHESGSVDPAGPGDLSKGVHA